MGWHPVEEVLVKRDPKTREIVVSWYDAVTGKSHKRFPATKEYPKNANKEAFECARLALSELSM